MRPTGADDLTARGIMSKSFTQRTQERKEEGKNVRSGAEDPALSETIAIAERQGSLDSQKACSALGRSGLEPPTHGFSVRCSTN